MGFFLFHDHLHPAQIIGTALIFASIGLLAERTGTFKLDKGILMGLLTGLIFGFATTAWVYVGKHADSASWTGLSFAGPSLFILLINPKTTPKLKSFLSGSMLTRMTLLGVLYSISGLTQLMAFKAGNVSAVAPLLQTSIIITILLAIIFLRERARRWYKAAAAVICFAGVLLIV